MIDAWLFMGGTAVFLILFLALLVSSVVALFRCQWSKFAYRFITALVTLTLTLSVFVFATPWVAVSSISVDHMMRQAELVAVCKVIRWPWEDDGCIRSPCLVKIKVINVLIGNEEDTELLVGWGDHTAIYKNIKEGKEYVVFLRRWDSAFLDPHDKGDRRITYNGTKINNNYTRFTSRYWIRPIINGEVVWIYNQKMSISNLVEIILMEKNNANKRFQTTPLRSAAEP